MVCLLAAAKDGMEEVSPLLQDEDTDVVSSMSRQLKQLSWEEVKTDTTLNKPMTTLISMGLAFPEVKKDLPLDIEQSGPAGEVCQYMMELF